MLDRTRTAAQQTRAASTEVNVIALQIAALIDQLIALNGLTGTAAEKVAELRLQWPVLKPLLLSFDADSSVAALEPLRDLLQLLPDREIQQTSAHRCRAQRTD